MTEIEAIIPLLVYEDVGAAQDFLVKTFGFTAGCVMQDGEGKTVHAEVRAGELAIYLHQVAAEEMLVAPRTRDAVTAALVIHVADVDAHCQHARSHGARIAYGPLDQPYGKREYATRDPEGHMWYFQTPLAKPARADRGY
ncbi:hypothetical protein AYO44_02180 [Planctomycetaceae bacterium SCGC AG-212-F19]|nr:hypothetical protein AYO44_02180 [Planctomycetaceae bacterium SCGC AG-212-F19]